MTYDPQGGLGLWPGPIIDAHFRERGRQVGSYILYIVAMSFKLLFNITERVAWSNWCGTRRIWSMAAIGELGWMRIQGWSAGG